MRPREIPAYARIVQGIGQEYGITGTYRVARAAYSRRDVLTNPFGRGD